ncbi:MAG: leucine-rich repeat protein, partial [Huintestinicola sp.]
ENEKIKKAVIISILLGMSLSTVSASAEVIRDFEYDPERGCYYSVIYDLESGDILIDHTPIYFYEQGSESEVGDGKYTGYDLYYEDIEEFSMPNIRSWWWSGSKKSGYTIEWVGDGQEYLYATIKIPDSINGVDVVDIDGSCDFKEFDVNSENKYLKCIDNVVFSKDGKRLIAYAQDDRRREYTVPEGTEIIDRKAMWSCPYLCTVTIPDSVTEIRKSAFLFDSNLTLVNFHDFNVKIDRGAFSVRETELTNPLLKSSVTVSPKAKGNIVSWDKVANATYYEIYQKLNSGEYKLLKTTKATACKFTTLKSGKSYTFAVKPVAVIPAANYDKEKDEGEYPESFTIEGTMSGDIVVIGK